MSAATVAVPTPPLPNPFPGLRPFREEEEHLFFGRESQVDAMVNTLAATHFLAVVGTSGSGKSSLVNCGLRPALHRGLMARAGTAWRMAQFRPGRNPLQAMARALAQDGVLFRDFEAGGLTLAEIIETTLRMSKLGLIDIYEQARLGADVNLLVVVDQFEELFRYRQLGASQQENAYGFSEEAIAFVNLLLEVREQATCPIYVVLTMRSDFLGDCAQFRGLPEAINAGQYLVPRMTRDGRRAAISGPVGVGGAEITPVLLTRLVNDVGDNPDQLSILQHALNRTWSRWEHEGGGSGPLDLTHYEAIGTMAHALDQHAEQAYAALGTARQQQICQKLFKALTDKATDARGVRRPTTLGTLCALADATAAEVTRVIDVFRHPSRAFVMPPAGEALEAETVIDISHESLMRVWERLKTWANEEAQSAEIYRRLAETSVLHKEGQAGLWRDPDLQLTLTWREHNRPNEEWARRYHREFASSMRFLGQSRAARERQRWLRIGLTIGVIAVLGGFLGYALWQRAKAEERAITAEATLRWSPFDLSFGLSDREREGLFRLARDDQAVKRAFAKQVKEDAALAARFSTQHKAITRTLAGLDTVARDGLIQDLLITPMSTEAKPTVWIALGFLAAELEAAEGLHHLLEAMQATTHAGQLRALGEALAVLPGELTAAQAESAVGALVAAITDTTHARQLGEALAALAGKLTAAQAESAVGALVAAMQATTHAYQLRTLGEALAALAGKLTAAQAESAVGALVAAMQATTHAYQLWALGEALAVLPGELTAAQAEPAVGVLVAAMQATTHADQLRALGKALAVLPGELTAAQAESAVGALVAAITDTTIRPQLEALGKALAALAGKLTAAQAESAVGVLVAAVTDTTHADQLRALGEALAVLAGKLTAAQAESAVGALVAAITDTTIRPQLEALGKALAALAGKLTAAQAESAVGALVAAMQATTHADQIGPLGRALAALAGKLTAAQAESAVGALVTAITDTTHADQIGPLGRALAALAGKLTAAQAESAVGALVAAMQATTHADQIGPLGRALAALAGKLTAAQAESAVGALVTAITATTHADQIGPLGRALAALAGKLTAAQAESAVGALVAAITDTTDRYQLGPLGKALAALAGKLTAAQAESAVGALVAAITDTTIRPQLEALGKALVVLAGKLTAAQAESAVGALVAAITDTTDRYQLGPLGKALAALAGKLSDDQAFATLIFEILKYPPLAGNPAEDTLLDAVRKRFKDKGAPAKKKGFWAMVKWAEKQFPHLDLKSPPKMVSEEILGKGGRSSATYYL